MNVAIPLVALAALAFYKRGDAAAPVKTSITPNTGTVKKDVAKLVRESKEIVQGKRDSYSDDPKKKVTPIDAARKVQAAAKSTDADALRAAQAAANSKAAPTPKPAPKPAKPVLRPAPDFRGGVLSTPLPKPVAAPKPVKPLRPKVVAPKPAPAPAPAPAPKGPTPPAGYDRVKASNAAPDVARHIALKKYSYDRKVLKAWQLLAGIATDGIYGKGSAAALRYYTPTAPKPLFAQGTDSYPWGQ